MTREQALRKVRACLRLGASSNPNESAAALRQARSLMDKYGLTHAEAAGVQNADAATRQRGASLPVSVATLANMVADGFGCRMLIVRRKDGRAGSTVVRFYGMASAATVAAYAFTVLRRQLDNDRQRYARIRLKSTRSDATRKARLERFSIGWVHAIESLFPTPDTSHEHSALIEAQIRHENGDDLIVTYGRDDIGNRQARRNWNDEINGFAMGKGARLHGALTPSETQPSTVALANDPRIAAQGSIA